MSRRAVLASLGVVAASTAGWRWLRPTGARVATPAAGTATVVRTDLAAREQLAGTLGYAEDWRVEHLGPAGVLTWAPPPATVVGRGEPLYEIDGRPVRLLLGARPAWRALGPGVAPGADVRQLEENLLALGFPAVRRWQAATGQPVTGRVPLGTVVFMPEPVRVVEVLSPVGARLGGGAVLRVSSNRAVVSAALPTTRQGQVRAGSPVEVTMPGGASAPGKVREVGRIAMPDRPITIGLDGPVTGGLDQAPVLVTLTTAERHGVLAVPLTALRADRAGGYEVLVSPARRPVTVRPGLLDERAGLIEVAGDGIAAGTLVEVPG